MLGRVAILETLYNEHWIEKETFEDENAFSFLGENITGNNSFSVQRFEHRREVKSELKDVKTKLSCSSKIKIK